ncbi:lysine 2,3-aminomutase [Actinomadura sp. NPDC048394]|uniref:lysine 2,3-aminomutase n=1 Tax=Actinomadura sp. NPDC048394 TaxID=3158223 RepID=UPI0033DBDA50
MPDDTVRRLPRSRRHDREFRLYTTADLDELTARAGLPADQRLAVRAAATVVPFAITGYVAEELIDWTAGIDDPIYRLTFPQPDMLPAEQVSRLCDLLIQDAAPQQVTAAAREWERAGAPQRPAPAPIALAPLGGQAGDEVVLTLPDPHRPTGGYGTDHASSPPPHPDRRPRWAATPQGLRDLAAYVLAHPHVTSVVINGDEPMTAGAPLLARCLDTVTALDQIQTVQLETAALARWPYRWITQPGADADDTLRLFETVATAGKNLTVMARLCHPREMEPEPVRQASRRIGDTGAVIRTRGPLMAGINDSVQDWTRLWRRQLRLGMIPFLMTLEDHSGPTERLAVPLGRARELFQQSYAQVSGLARTVRGPAMTTASTVIYVDGITEIQGEKVFMLRFASTDDRDLFAQPFFARYDPDAVAPTALEPIAGLPFPHEALTAGMPPASG